MFSESTQKKTCSELDEKKTRFVVPLKQAKSKQLKRKEHWREPYNHHIDYHDQTFAFFPEPLQKSNSDTVCKVFRFSKKKKITGNFNHDLQQIWDNKLNQMTKFQQQKTQN